MIKCYFVLFWGRRRQQSFFFFFFFVLFTLVWSRTMKHYVSHEHYLRLHIKTKHAEKELIEGGGKEGGISRGGVVASSVQNGWGWGRGG